MPTKTHTFDTPAPIRLRLTNPRGRVELIAADRAETVVTITSRRDGTHTVDASADGRTVNVESGKFFGIGRAPEVDIVVHLPSGSDVDVSTGSATVDSSGALGQVVLKGASGQTRIDRVLADADLTLASGDVRVGPVGGRTRVRSASGNVVVDSSEGPVEVTSASGSVEIGRAASDVTVKSASGSQSVREVSSGEVRLTTASGDVSIGVRKGRLVWLDLVTASGRTTNELVSDEPGEGEEDHAVRLRVRTASGDITVAPSSPATTPA